MFVLNTIVAEILSEIADELEKAKNQLESSFIYAQDSLFYQAMLLARHEISGGWKTLMNYVPSIR